MSEATELTILTENLRAELVFIPGGADSILTSIERRAREQAAALDVTKPKDREGFGSLRFKVRRLKTTLDDAGKQLKSDYQAKITPIDAERRTIRERMEVLEEEIYKPLADFQTMEATRVATHEEAIRQIEAWGVVAPDETSRSLGYRMEVYSESDLLTRNWQEFQDKAQTAARNSFNALKVAKIIAVEREIEAFEASRLAAIETERLRVQAACLQAERETRIAAEAAERARVDAEVKAAQEAAEAEYKAAVERAAIEARDREAAERAEAEKARIVREAEQAAAEAKRREQEAAAAAERDRQAAAQREREAQERAEKSERDRVEAARIAEERRVTAERQAELDRLAAIEAERRRVAQEAAKVEAEQEARALGVAHQRKVHQAIIKALLEACEHEPLTESQCRLIISAIRKGEVPRVSIGY